jgi:hypothetical protein
MPEPLIHGKDLPFHPSSASLDSEINKVLKRWDSIQLDLGQKMLFIFYLSIFFLGWQDPGRKSVTWV